MRETGKARALCGRDLRMFFRDGRNLSIVIMMALLLIPLLIGIQVRAENRSSASESDDATNVTIRMDGIDDDDVLTSFIRRHDGWTLLDDSDGSGDATGDGAVTIETAPSNASTHGYRVTYTDDDAALAAVLQIDRYLRTVNETTLQRGGGIVYRMTAEREDGGGTTGTTGILRLSAYFVSFVAATTMSFLVIQLIAAERERKTIPLLLVSGMGRGTVALGKFLAVSIGASGGVCLSFVGQYAGLALQERTDALDGITMTSVPFIAAFALLITMLISGIGCVVGVMARTQAQASAVMSFLNLAVLIACMAPMLYSWNVDDDPMLAFVPMVNLVIAYDAAVANDIDVVFFAVTAAMTCVLTAGCLLFYARLFRRETVIL